MFLKKKLLLLVLLLTTSWSHSEQSEPVDQYGVLVIEVTHTPRSEKLFYENQIVEPHRFVNPFNGTPDSVSI